MNNIININPKVAEPVFPIVKDGAGNFIHQIPEGLHSGFIKGDSEGSQRTKAALNSVARQLTDLNVGRVRLDPDHSNQVKRGFSAIGNAITEARNVLKTEAKQLTDSLIEKSGFKPDASYISFVVGTFQAMQPNERVDAINKLIEQGDGSTLAILDRVSTVFTGLSDDMKGSIRTRLFAKADSQTFARLQDAQFNLNRIEIASIASADAAAKFFAPMHKAETSAKETHHSNIK